MILASSTKPPKNQRWKMNRGGQKKKEEGKTQTKKEEEKEKEIRWRIKREKSSADNIIFANNWEITLPENEREQQLIDSQNLYCSKCPISRVVFVWKIGHTARRKAKSSSRPESNEWILALSSLDTPSGATLPSACTSRRSRLLSASVSNCKLSKSRSHNRN